MYDFLIGLAVGFWFVVGVQVLFGPDEPPAPTLAGKINTVCKKGYYAADWSMGSSWYGTPQPDGVVRVVCASVKDRYDIYNVAVEE